MILRDDFVVIRPRVLGAGSSSQFQNTAFACRGLGKYKVVYWERGKSWPVLKMTVLDWTD